MRMHNPPHPGAILRHRWLDPLGLTITATAAQLKVSRKAVSELVNGHTGITPESWLGHQSAFDLWQMHDRVQAFGVQRIDHAAHA